MEHSEDHIERIKSQLHASYNVRMDRSIVVMILEIKKQIELSSKPLTDATVTLTEASEKIKSSSKSLAVDEKNYKGQAFYFALGKYLWAVILVLSLSVAGFIYYYNSDYYMIGQAKRKLAADPLHALELYRGFILNTGTTGALIEDYYPPSSKVGYRVVAIPKTFKNTAAEPGLCYWEDSSKIYIRVN